ncbi:MAG: hypothetical protein H6Q70_2198 [Firmicutes bacterium]|nr:hypothetical protein [Bacillota bacterium]
MQWLKSAWIRILDTTYTAGASAIAKSIVNTIKKKV